MTKQEIANKIYSLQNGQSFEFEFKNENNDTIYAAATAVRLHDLDRVFVSAYGRDEYDRIFTEFDSVDDIVRKLDFIRQ